MQGSWESLSWIQELCRSSRIAAERFTGSLGDQNSKRLESLICCAPHPRSRIYFSAGHERIMEDVLKGAASFGGRTFWLRNDDGSRIYMNLIVTRINIRGLK
ncbi:Late embryogenesis abundant protein, LEA5-type [Melia azedarach]|uniref:Late embryogenesis abundant protein, LEA5-type n=1 Tax=Melia azedarach TaxID=155640 RepID=A0ACC1XXX0_MELAZ|nr:Late embryogenesis abundant protein, LEA5-type [Melia azedarach]